MKVASRDILNQVKDEALQVIENSKCRILICAGTGCLAGGSGAIYDKCLNYQKMIIVLM